MTPKLKPLTAALLLITGSQGFAVTQVAIQSHQPTPSVIKQSLTENLLILSTGAFDPKNQALNFQAVGINSIASSDYGIVQFESGKADAKWLKSQGFRVIQSLPTHAFLVNWQQQSRDNLSKNKDIRWHGPFQSGFKISPNLWQSNRAALISYTLSVVAFDDYPREHLEALIKKQLPSAKLVNTTIPKSDNRLVIELTAEDFNQKLNKLASAEGIQWINSYVPARFFNEDAVPAVQDTSSNLNDQSIFDHGIYGTNQIVGIADSGLDHNEDWFAHYDNGLGVNTAITAAENTTPPLIGNLSNNNKVVGYWIMPGALSYDHASAGYHGTHVSGSVAGDKRASGSTSSPSQSGYDANDGMAPNAQILFQDIGSSSGLTGVGSSPMWQQAYNAGARIHSNSYGADTFGEYVGSDQSLDRTLHELEDMIIVMAAGNDAGPVNTISSPGNAKNALTVGALNHGNSSTIASYSNRGFTDDGRLKPDISTTGTSISSASGNSDNSNVIDSTPATKSMSGTSMATPITAGTTALLRQYFTDGFYPTGARNAVDSLIPSGPLMKAMLLNGSNPDSGFNNRNSGWGRPWLANTLYFSGDGNKTKFWDVTHENGLGTGDSITFNVDVLAGQEFRSTLVWYDLPGPTGSAVTLVNNLNLTVIAPNGTYLGNNFNGNAQATSVTGGSADNINTVEQVRLTAPQTGTYQLTVSAPTVPGDGSFGSDRQGFALAVNGDLGSLSPLSIGDPANLTAFANGSSGINLNWNLATNADYYEIYRSTGTCQSIEPGSQRFVGQSGNTTFTDMVTTGGYNYAYQVRAYNSDQESNLTNCVDVTSSQACLIPPQFNGNQSQVVATQSETCSVQLAWPAGSSNCPADTNVNYNIYRSTQHNFIPVPANLLTTVASGSTQYSDFSAVNNQSYYYRIQASNSGNTSTLSQELAATPVGTTSTTIGNITDDVDNALLMSFTPTWSVSNDRASNGTLSYRSTYEGASSYTSNTCARMYSPMIAVPSSGSPSVDYQAWYEIEAEWDGVVVEISNDGGSSWSDLPPIGGYPSDFSSTGNPAINGCGYPASQGAFGGASSGFDVFSHDLAGFGGDTIQLRWSFSTDPGFELEGFYLDDISYNNVYTFESCTAAVLDLIFEDGFE